MTRDEEDEAIFQVKNGVALADLKGLLVLDAGCGGGRYARLAGRSGARVVGVDLSSAVEKAARSAPTSRTSRSCRPTCSTCRWPRGCSTWPSRSA
ncbi:MAG: methyltransferase domain-containing protein [Isosphaeraceae bacterium]